MTGVASPETSHHNLVLADRATERPRPPPPHESVTGFTPCSLLHFMWSQSCCHLVKMHWWRKVLRLNWGLKIPGNLEFWLPWQQHLPCCCHCYLTWPGIHVSAIIKLQLDSMWQVVYNTKISGWVRSGIFEPCIVFMEFIRSKNLPGRKLPP